MKLVKNTETRSRKIVTQRGSRALLVGNMPVYSNKVVKFRGMVRKRPDSNDWLIRYGQLGKELGLTYAETFGVVKAQVRKCRGNIRLKWVHNGLKQGFNDLGLTA